MIRLRKFSMLLFAILLVASASLVIPVHAYSQPPTPEFTVNYIDESYDVPSTYEVDQFTGQTIVKQNGYHVDKQSVVFTIKNPSFTPNPDSSSGLYYNFRFKGTYGTDWSYYPFGSDGQSSIPYSGYSWGTGDLSPKISASNSEYTVTSVDLAILLGISSGYSGHASLSSGTKIEFQVQSLCGQMESESSGLLAGSFYTFTGESSGWSSSQTMTVGVTLPTTIQTVVPTESPTQSPTVTSTESPTAEPTYTDNSTLPVTQQDFSVGIDWQTTVIAILATAVVGLVVIVAVLLRKNRTRKGGLYQ